jgi:hypothetical protein
MSTISGDHIIPNIIEFSSFINDLRVRLIEGLNLQRAKYNFELIPETASLEFAVQKANEMVDYSNAYRESLISTVNNINDTKYKGLETTTDLENTTRHVETMLNGAEASRVQLIEHINENRTAPIPDTTCLDDAIEQVKVMFDADVQANSINNEMDLLFAGKYGYMSPSICNGLLTGNYFYEEN